MKPRVLGAYGSGRRPCRPMTGTEAGRYRVEVWVFGPDWPHYATVFVPSSTSAVAWHLGRNLEPLHNAGQPLDHIRAGIGIMQLVALSPHIAV